MKKLSLVLLLAAAAVLTVSARPTAPRAAVADACSLPAKKPVWIDFADGSVPFWEVFAKPGNVAGSLQCSPTDVLLYNDFAVSPLLLCCW